MKRPLFHRGKRLLIFGVACLWPLPWAVLASPPTDDPDAEVFSVVELAFRGPHQDATDTPARDIDFHVLFRHESGAPEYTVHGFWDGDGQGAPVGDVFKVRFCPTRPGRWTLVEVQSNRPELAGKRRGDSLLAVPSARHGFWEVDDASPGRRWYRRSDGTHQFIFGNTHYSFLSGYGPRQEPGGGDIAADVRGNAEYFKKLRFGLLGCRYPHPHEKPFLDDHARPTDDGNYSHRPNPRWFGQRADVAVKAAFEADLIADLILAGPDVEHSRSTLRADRNHGDATPWLRYVAARYASFPNVWLCLCNEFDIKSPRYSPEQMAAFGRAIRRWLPYPTPLSVHTVPQTLWPSAFDALPPWHDHQIIQKKLRTLGPSADAIQSVWQNPGGQPRRKPTVNDELSYQGHGDQHSQQDTIESHLGAFLGGGYGSTGYKSAQKLGQYFWGRFDPSEHSAAASLRWLRTVIDAQITFWQMAPDLAVFENLDGDFRGLAWPGHEYVLGTNKLRAGIVANLPPGTWSVTRHDAVARQSTVLSSAARGRFVFDAPAGRAVLFCFKRHYFPPPESQGGWRRLEAPDAIRATAGMAPQKLDELRRWLLASDTRDFAATIVRRGWIVLEVQRGNSARTDARRVASVSKAICATVLAIASQRSRQGLTPLKMTFDDAAFQYIPWAQPLSDPRKAAITVRQLLNHTSGICPEAVGAPNDGTWQYVLGHSGDPRTARLAFDPGTACGYSTHALHHAALVCETVTGQPYDEFAVEALFRPIGVEHWWFQHFDGGAKYGRHPSHALGLPAGDLARIAYCMLRGGQWDGQQVIPAWFVAETGAATHEVQGRELRFKINAQVFSHGWELPALLTGEDNGPSGAGIPADARYKPGSGGQLIAFVPSLDLVVTRQTGASGAWDYAEYLRRACAAVVDDVPH